MDYWLKHAMKRLGCAKMGCTWEQAILPHRRAQRMMHLHPAQPQPSPEAVFWVTDRELVNDQEGMFNRWEMRVVADHQRWNSPTSDVVRAINGDYDEEFERSRLQAVPNAS